MSYALTFVGTPYMWGGNNKLTGLDCSGLVQEILRSAGEAPPGDLTAQGLFDHFSQGRGEWNRVQIGSLIWFGESTSKITHVAMALDQYRMIEAGGGSSRCLTVDDAKKCGAMVRVRPIASRKDRVAIIKPYFRGVGQI